MKPDYQPDVADGCS